jgi:hypothetical protein
MADLAYDVDVQENTTRNRIIDFNSYRPYNGTVLKPSFLVNMLRGNDVFEAYLKEYIENSIYTIFTQMDITKLNNFESPFDSIYLCDLSPDIIEKSDFNKLNNIVSRIEDRSDEITFNDGFVDAEGNFLNRREAYKHALACNQIKPKKDNDLEFCKRYNLNPTDHILKSEDLY